MSAAEHIPTPEQIAERAAAIRAEWSPAEREKRLRVDWRRMRWTVPEGVTPEPERESAP